MWANRERAFDNLLTWTSCSHTFAFFLGAGLSCVVSVLEPEPIGKNETPRAADSPAQSGLDMLVVPILSGANREELNDTPEVAASDRMSSACSSVGRLRFFPSNCNLSCELKTVPKNLLWVVVREKDNQQEHNNEQKGNPPTPHGRSGLFWKGRWFQDGPSLAANGPRSEFYGASGRRVGGIGVSQ